MGSDKVPNLLTVGEIARQLHQPDHRIRYVLLSRNIQPAGRAGIAWVFDEAAFDRVAAEIRRMDADAALR
jgi:hypothetical protein